MLITVIEYHKNQWFTSDDCTVRPIIDYIKNKGQLREAQYEAIETYLFLKIKGQNQPLWKIFSEEFFSDGEDLSKPKLLKRIITKENLPGYNTWLCFIVS